MNFKLEKSRIQCILMSTMSSSEDTRSSETRSTSRNDETGEKKKRKKGVLVGEVRLMKPSKRTRRRDKSGIVTVDTLRRKKRRLSERKLNDIFNIHRLYNHVDQYKESLLKATESLINEKSTIYDIMALHIVRKAISEIKTNVYSITDV